MHTNTYGYLKSNKKHKNKKQHKKKERERERVENDSSGVVGDVEETGF